MLSTGHGGHVALFSSVLATAKSARTEALELLERINAGTADLNGSDRQDAVEVLNGTLNNYNQIIKRLSSNRWV